MGQLISNNEQLKSDRKLTEKYAAELVRENIELPYQNEQIDQRTTKLVIANMELAFQKKKIENLAEEIFIAAKALTLEHKEETKRTEQLINVNNALNLLSNDQNKDANQLVITNIELSFQNEERIKRAACKVPKNTELALRNAAAKKRSDEVISSNKKVDELEQRVKGGTEDLEVFSYCVFSKDIITNNVIHLQNGAKALEFLFSKGTFKGRDCINKPKAIPLGLKMPKVDGLEVLTKIKANPHTKSIPVVVLTSSKEHPDIERAYALGADSFIEKPIQP